MNARNSHPGPIVALMLAVEPLLRFIAGTLKNVETVGTAPGAALCCLGQQFEGVFLFVGMIGGPAEPAAVSCDDCPVAAHEDGVGIRGR